MGLVKVVMCFLMLMATSLHVAIATGAISSKANMPVDLSSSATTIDTSSCGQSIVTDQNSVASHQVTGINPQESFLRCLLNHSLPSNLVNTPSTAAYAGVFESTVHNVRFLSPDNARPALIVTPTEASHAQASVVCARATALGLRVRSGGHDYEGLSYVAATGSTAPFVVLDLAKLRAVDVDAGTRTAWVGAGATLGELYHTVAKKCPTSGFPAGICPTIGVGGHLSGGGFGAMLRKYGLAADNVVDAHLVDAGGRLLDRSTMGEDLFWAIRGGGAASFGVVLSYKVRLVVVPPTVTVFAINKTLRQNATELVARWQQVADKFVDDLFIRVLLQAVNDTASPGNRTINAAFECLYLGKGEELLAYLDKAFPELGVTSKDLLELTWIESVMYLAGFRNKTTEVLLTRSPAVNSSFKAKSDFLEQPISEAGWKKIWEFLLQGTNEPMVMIIDPFGGRMDEVPATATPFPHRKGSRYNIQYFMLWFTTEAALTHKHLEWMRQLYDFMEPYVSRNPRAAYINYKDIDLGRNEGVGKGSYQKASVWGRKYFKNNYRRLAFVKSKVDPDNFFWSEQSIPPLLAPSEEP